jgi:hypothetical protein
VSPTFVLKDVQPSPFTFWICAERALDDEVALCRSCCVYVPGVECLGVFVLVIAFICVCVRVSVRPSVSVSVSMREGVL